MKKAEHIAAYFDAARGVAPRWPASARRTSTTATRASCRSSPAGPTVIGDGVLARAENADVVFCQLVPWQFDPKKQMNLKRTFRRASCLVTRLAATWGRPGPRRS